MSARLMLAKLLLLVPGLAAALSSIPASAVTHGQSIVTLVELVNQPPALGTGVATLGVAFTLNEPLPLIGLGWYDADQDGLSTQVEIGLWRDNFGANGGLVASAAIPAGTAAVLNGQWRAVPVAPQTLQPGTYRLGGLTAVGSTDPVELVSFLSNGLGNQAVFDPRIMSDTIGPALTVDGSGTLVFPESTLLVYGGYFGATIITPEPGTAVLVAFGTMILAHRRR